MGRIFEPSARVWDSLSLAKPNLSGTALTHSVRYLG